MVTGTYIPSYLQLGMVLTGIGSAGGHMEPSLGTKACVITDAWYVVIADAWYVVITDAWYVVIADAWYIVIADAWYAPVAGPL